MTHLIKNIYLLDDYMLNVEFYEGITKNYDVKPLIESDKKFSVLSDEDKFSSVVVEAGGKSASWGKGIKLSCDELFENAERVSTVFDGLISLGDATQIWGLSDSTLRKAIASGKLIEGEDASKYGKQWVLSFDAVVREYGMPE